MQSPGVSSCGFYLWHKHHIASYHHIISHSIASYIILHQQKSCGKGKCSFENTCRIVKECAEAQSIPSTDIFLHSRGIFISSITIQQPWKNMWYSIVRRDNFSSWSMKRREGFFRQRLKNGTYEGFMHHKEIYYINVHTNTWCLFLTQGDSHTQALHFQTYKNLIFL
jgi:hypothetical protein